jgi:hypothetical protein
LKIFSAVDCDLNLRMRVMPRCGVGGVNHERGRVWREMAKGDVMKTRNGREFRFHVPFLSLNGAETADEETAS